eukprot:GILJ01022886.1.p1 GENE.GILJ01022886.1~~GILJ01022886.1.p1  ORF type:complete len:391 (+),score=45.65 GILJ01022886.1:62-1174(+)
MVDESMVNIKSVVRDRDFEATDRAVAIFKERMTRGVYRYPPGPQPPSDYGVDVSTVRVVLSKKVSEDRLRELFGKYDVFESHKGIVKIDLVLSDEAMSEKEMAEESWKHYQTAKRRFEGYHAFDNVESIFDHSEAELTPGTYFGDATTGGENEGESVLRAVDVESPQTAESDEGPTKTLERLRWMSQPPHLRAKTNFNYYPIVSTELPEDIPARPTHPDEIEGPWVATITYDKADGCGYAMGLEISKIDGANVIGIEQVPFTQPFAGRCPMYQEAIGKEEADEETTHQWPNVPTWKHEYNKYTKKKVADIIMYNYSNVTDYVDREVLLTGKSSWELPIPIDHSCGNAFVVPAHAKNNKDKSFTRRAFNRF